MTSRILSAENNAWNYMEVLRPIVLSLNELATLAQDSVLLPHVIKHCQHLY